MLYKACLLPVQHYKKVVVGGRRCGEELHVQLTEEQLVSPALMRFTAHFKMLYTTLSCLGDKSTSRFLSLTRLQLFFTFPLNLQHFVCLLLRAKWQSKHKSQWSVVLTWTELCFNSTNKSKSREQYQTCNRSCSSVTSHAGRNPEFVFNTAVEEVLPFLQRLQRAFCDEKWCLRFHTWCLTCLRERELFLLISWRHSFCVVHVFFFSFSAHLDPCGVQHQACTRHDVTVFVYCVSFLHVYEHFLLEIYKSVRLWEPHPFSSLEHPDCMNVFFLFPSLFVFISENGKKKSREENVLTGDTEGNIIFLIT